MRDQARPDTLELGVYMAVQIPESGAHYDVSVVAHSGLARGVPGGAESWRPRQCR